MPAPARLQLVVDQLDVRPSDHIVEVGCGHGVAAALVLERLPSGTYTGIDRSPAMIAASERRNRDAVTTGRARFIAAPCTVADLGAATVDVVFAVRVAAMTRPAELAAAARCLVSGGRLVLAFDAPSAERTAALVAEAGANLAAAGFSPGRIADGVLVALRA
jgi:ubiquinone/menaquinone biosynthesis C-methylase UbiE